MAKSKNAVNKISDKLSTVNDNFNVYMYDNGFMLEIGGKDHDDNWTQAKIMCSDVEVLMLLIKEAAQLDRD